MNKTLAFVLVSSFAPVLCGQGSILAVRWDGSTCLIDSATGGVTALGPSGTSSLNSLAYNPQNGLFYSVSGGPSSTSSGSLWTINPITGMATNTGVLVTVSDVRGLAFTPGGACYAIVNGGVDSLYTINVSTGQATLVGSTGNPNLQALASDAAGGLWAWAVDPNGGANPNAHLASINVATGFATLIGAAAAQIQALGFSPSGVLYGCTGTLYTVDTTTGATTPVGTTGAIGDVRGIEFTNQTLPSVSFLPPNGYVAPGGALTVTYSAPSHANEFFAPIVSCTLGSFSAPVLPQPLGITWDFCTDFYFNDPAGLYVMPLSGVPGSYVGVLDGAGTASGYVFPPLTFPPGLNLPVHVTWVSWNNAYILTVHGLGTFHVN